MWARKVGEVGSLWLPMESTEPYIVNILQEKSIADRAIADILWVALGVVYNKVAPYLFLGLSQTGSQCRASASFPYFRLLFSFVLVPSRVQRRNRLVRPIWITEKWSSCGPAPRLILQHRAGWIARLLGRTLRASEPPGKKNEYFGARR